MDHSTGTDPPESHLGDPLERLALEDAPDAMVVIDPDLRVVWANAAATRVLGYAEGEGIGQSILDFVHPDDLRTAAGAMGEASRFDGYHIAVPVRLRRADGSYVPTRVTGTTRTLADGQWMVLSARPIDDEQAIEGRRSRLRALAETFYMECAAMRWQDADERVTSMLGVLAEVLGAGSVEVAERVDQQGDLLVRAAWRDSRLGDRRGSGGGADPGSGRHGPVHGDGTPFVVVAPPAELLERPCVITPVLGSSLEREWSSDPDEVVEMALDWGHGHAGVARVGFSPVPPEWDDANADVVALMCSTLMATVGRCRDERRLHHLARTDPLTGLHNRAALLDHLGELMQGVGGHHARPVVLFADLNDFKELNDRFGHREGDVVLRTAAEAILAIIRGGDIAARLGGDEFVVVFDAPAEDAGRLVARTRIAVDRALRRWPGLSAAMGAITVGPHDSPEDVIDRADLAMYRDKRSKRRQEARRPGAAEGVLLDLATGGSPGGAGAGSSAPGPLVDVVLVLDELGVVQLASPAAQDLLGFGPDDSVGMDGLGLVHPGDMRRAIEAMATTLTSTVPPGPVRLRVRDVTGAYRPVVVSAVDRLDDPDIRGIVVTVRDRSDVARPVGAAAR